MQTGTAGILFLAGWAMLRFLREERLDRAQEREGWLKELRRIADVVTAAVAELRENQRPWALARGISRDMMDDFERWLNERRKEVR